MRQNFPVPVVMDTEKPDLIYSKPVETPQDFSFDAQVVEVFPDMIKRSVPGYSTIIDTIGKLSRQFVKDNTNIYDLGCSLGAATIAMRRNIGARNCKIVAIDSSQAMVDKCAIHVNAFKSVVSCDVIADDILTHQYNNASMIVLNFTLQFIEPTKRESLLRRIYDALIPGGILVLSEKLIGANEHIDDVLVDMHHEFKRNNGYSELEISQKRNALENVMIPDTLEAHITRLDSIGFSTVTPWFQCFNFCSMVAIK